jgi:hypothetical protein
MTDRQARRRSSALERDLARLADDTLAGPRRELLERLLARSPELQRRLDLQRRVVHAVRSSGARERAPLAVRVRHRALTTRRDGHPFRPERLGVGLGLAGALAALASILALVGGGQAGPTVAQAATLAARPATGRVAEPAEDSVTLPGLRAAGLPFPYWEDRFGWRATGVRADRVDGRATTTVFYTRGSEQIAYTIVAGKPLPPGATARYTTRAHTALTTLTALSTARGQRVVSWLRRGHTCVLSGRDVPLSALVELAAWRAHGQIPY